jgi:hypothetical protein
MKTTLILIIMGTSIFAFAQKNIEVDSSEIILNLLKKEYMPFEKISFNKNKIHSGLDWKIVLKTIQTDQKKCFEYDEDGSFETECFF